MNLFWKRTQLIEPAVEPAPVAESAMQIAERELDAATADCLRLDEERRAWGRKREEANYKFNSALTSYHAALDAAERN